MTEGQVRVAIQVLRAYVDDVLRIADDDLAAELEQAIEDAGNKQVEGVIFHDPPVTPSA